MKMMIMMMIVVIGKVIIIMMMISRGEKRRFEKREEEQQRLRLKIRDPHRARGRGCGRGRGAFASGFETPSEGTQPPRGTRDVAAVSSRPRRGRHVPDRKAAEETSVSQFPDLETVRAVAGQEGGGEEYRRGRRGVGVQEGEEAGRRPRLSYTSSSRMTLALSYRPTCP